VKEGKKASIKLRGDAVLVLDPDPDPDPDRGNDKARQTICFISGNEANMRF
jgi:hypothetical protein